VRTVVVLQSRQPLTTAVTAGFDGCEVLILTDGRAEDAVREDVEGAAVRTLSVPRAGWDAELTRLAAQAQAQAQAPGALEVVTNDEYCVSACRRFRHQLGLPPRHPATIENYLDKIVMKRRLAAAGVPVPRFRALEPAVDPAQAPARELVAELGLPLVVKPRAEANSRGVRVLATLQQVAAWLDEHRAERGWQVEQHLPGSGYHVNALIRQGRVVQVQAGQYLGPLLDLPQGRRLGAVTLPQDAPVAAQLHRLNAEVVAALGAQGDFVVHTEVLKDAHGQLTVMEVAARAPGALVSHASLLHAGLQLETANLRMQAGLAVPDPAATGVQAAWLMVPVMPGERFDHPPGFSSEHALHVRRAGRIEPTGHSGNSGTLGLTILLWNPDPDVLARDVVTALEHPWFTVAVTGGHPAG
jgi:biotin carboxylase